ncbi:MAG: hypothetical protein IJA97_01830 [Clostridia bacterium]|nr:hypothetical protein [Clostridia bacterium]
MDGKMFILGLSLGMIGGAILVANSYKARKLVRDSQEQIRKKADELSKCKCCDCENEGEENS